MSNEDLHVQPLSYWLDQIDKMDVDNLTKIKKYISTEILQRKLKTLTTVELYKLLSKCKSNISNMTVDDTTVEVGDDV